MRLPKRGFATFSACVLLGTGAIAQTVDQSDVLIPSFGWGISFQPSYNDFAISGSAAILSGATVWLGDFDDQNDGALNRFSQQLLWAIVPFTGPYPTSPPLVSGTAVNLVPLDTGLQDAHGDVIQVRFEFDRLVKLAPGAYWLGLKEAPWNGWDGTDVFWISRTGHFQQPVVFFANGFWQIPFPFDAAMALQGAAPAWDQSETSTANAWNLSLIVSAADFSLTKTEGLSAIYFWIWDQNGTSFSGSMSWAIFSNDGGKPGTLLASGTDAAPVLTPTGQTSGDFHIRGVRVRIQPSVTLGPGDYWLALHEGQWGSAFDGTAIYWGYSTGKVGEESHYTYDLTGASGWGPQHGNDPAFLLFSGPGFSAGFEAGVTCVWSNANEGCP